MGMHPNTFLAADITGPDLDKVVELLTKDDEIIFLVGNIYYQGTQGNDDAHYLDENVDTLRLYDYVTYGYGEIVSFDKVDDMQKDLNIALNEFVRKHNLNVQLKFVIGATYW